MSAQHTRGRMQQGAKYPQDITTPDGHYTIARTLPQPSAAVAEANARRIAACWNALEGIDTDDIDSGRMVIITKMQDEAAKQVLSQRDEMLELLKSMSEWDFGAMIYTSEHENTFDRLACKARLLIGKAEKAEKGTA